MTDLALNSVNDLSFFNGDLVLIQTVEELTRQRLLNKLRTFTGTLFTNINYGIDVTLIFEKGTKEFLDQHLKTLIAETPGIEELVEFTSTVGVDRYYRLQFRYKITTGDIVGIKGLTIMGGSSSLPVSNLGIWKDGYWDYSGYWDDEEIWGGDPGNTVWFLEGGLINPLGTIYSDNIITV